MKNIYYKLYQQSIFRLTSTMIIKDVNIANAINDEITLYGLLETPINPLDPESWKYYQNLAGIYHELDVPMEVISLDTLETIPFTIESLQNHRVTRKKYSLNSTHYKALIKKYPKQESLIRGILNPIDMNTAIAADDREILWYDSKEVESNEHNLIPLLGDWIKTFFDRFWIAGYALTNNLYPAALNGVMYTYLNVAVTSIRNDNAKTNQAHSFHIWNYLDSNGYLAKFKEYLTKEQSLWLYRNIKWVRANAGQQRTFESMLENILTKREIPLGSMRQTINTKDMLTELRGQVELYLHPLNLHDVVSEEPQRRRFGYVMEREVPHATVNEVNLTEHTEYGEDVFSLSMLSDKPTKVYESVMYDSSFYQPITLGEFLLREWAHLSLHDLYDSIVLVQNPKTSDTMTMSVKEAFAIWVYLTTKVNGSTLTNVPTLEIPYTHRKILPTFEQLRGVTETKYVDDSDIEALLSTRPKLVNIISTETFYEFAVDAHNRYLGDRMWYASQTDKNIRAQYEMMVDLCYVNFPWSYDLDGVTSYEDIFVERNWDLESLSNTDSSILATEILKASTGVIGRDEKTLKEIQGALLQLMSQLGAYSSQYIQTINDEAAHVLDPVTMRVGDVDEAANSRRYLELPGEVRGYLSNFSDTRELMNDNINSSIKFEDKFDQVEKVDASFTSDSKTRVNSYHYQETLSSNVIILYDDGYGDDGFYVPPFDPNAPDSIAELLPEDDLFGLEYPTEEEMIQSLSNYVL